MGFLGGLDWRKPFDLDRFGDQLVVAGLGVNVESVAVLLGWDDHFDVAAQVEDGPCEELVGAASQERHADKAATVPGEHLMQRGSDQLGRARRQALVSGAADPHDTAAMCSSRAVAALPSGIRARTTRTRRITRLEPIADPRANASPAACAARSSSPAASWLIARSASVRARALVGLGFIDTEHALDLAWAATTGVDTHQLLLCQPESGEQALQVASLLIGSGAVDVVVIDSIAGLVPRPSWPRRSASSTPGRRPTCSARPSEPRSCGCRGGGDQPAPPARRDPGGLPWKESVS